MQEQAKPAADLSQLVLAPSNKTLSGEFVALNTSKEAETAVCKANCSGHCSS